MFEISVNIDALYVVKGEGIVCYIRGLVDRSQVLKELKKVEKENDNARESWHDVSFKKEHLDLSLTEIIFCLI